MKSKDGSQENMRGRHAGQQKGGASNRHKNMPTLKAGLEIEGDPTNLEE